MTSTLETGMTVSHYHVIGPLGAGGMGEVYKAHDTTLERTVALKILPPALVRNDERVRRFIQEAKSASALNHPNIVTIYEIGQSEIGPHDDGAEERPIYFIAMELIEGATLRQKIYEERTDLRTLLGWLAQCADGLAKAHSAGLVHRDLKPENIMITRDGFAKVLDFGLAKLSVQRTAELSSDSTAVRDATREGALLGTVAYMSPEQVQGKVVDHRSDIFSFGSILYEAATRQRPFDADSDIDVMHRILHDKPAPIDEIDATVPAELRRMVRRCMSKDPERRYQSMRDVALELGEIVDEFEELSASEKSRSSGSLSQPIQIEPVVSKRGLWIGGSAVALVVLAAIGFGLWQWKLARAEKPPVAYSSMRIEPVTTSGEVTSCAISPDGKYMAYVLRESAQQSVVVRQIATGSDVRVVSPQSTLLAIAAFSPDGNYIFYRQSELPTGIGYWSLFQVPVLGGPSRKILFDVDTALSFSPDGKQFAFARGYMSSGQNTIFIANTDGTGERKLLMTRRFARVIAPAWSPDGKGIVTLQEAQAAGGVSLVAIHPVTSAKRAIGSTVWASIDAATWLPDGTGLLVVGGKDGHTRNQLWLQPYPDGEPARITNDLNDYAGASLSADGKTISTVQNEFRGELFVSAPDDETGGNPLREGIGNWRVYSADINRSGSIVYSFGSEKGTDIAVIDRPGAEARILTTDGKSDLPTISNDGKVIVYTSKGEDASHIWVMAVDGSGARQLTRGAGETSGICRDGKTVFYRTNATEVGQIWRIPLAGGTPVRIVDSALRFDISMDGTRLLWASVLRVAGRDEYRITAATADGKPIASWQPIDWSAGNWTPRADEVAFVGTAGGVSNVFLQPLNNAPPRQLTHFKRGRIAGIHWMPNGKLLIRRGYTRANAVLIRDFR